MRPEPEREPHGSQPSDEVKITEQQLRQAFDERRVYTKDLDEPLETMVAALGRATRAGEGWDETRLELIDVLFAALHSHVPASPPGP